MADRAPRHPRGGGDRPPHNDSGWRDRHSRGGRDPDRDERRDRHEGADRDRDYRRQRSRSRDRRDRRRSRSPLRERGHDRRDRDDRTRGGEGRGTHRRGEGRDQPKDREDRSEREHRGKSDRGARDRERDGHHAGSPRRSASPIRPQASPEKDAGLPTRSKPDPKVPGPVVPAAPVSFKVKGQDRREGSHGAEQHVRGGSLGHDDEVHAHDDEEQPRGRFDEDPMEEDDEDDVVVEGDGLDAMQAMMGFGGFGTTKNQKVVGNNAGGVRKEKKTEYRQYMNRVGGFNRPLSPGR